MGTALCVGPASHFAVVLITLRCRSDENVIGKSYLGETSILPAEMVDLISEPLYVMLRYDGSYRVTLTVRTPLTSQRIRVRFRAVRRGGRVDTQVGRWDLGAAGRGELGAGDGHRLLWNLMVYTVTS